MLDMNIFFTIFVMLCKHTNLRVCPNGTCLSVKFKMRNLFCIDVIHSTK